MSSTIAYLRNRNYSGINDINDIKDDFKKVNITVSYDQNITNGVRRVIFTADKGMRSQKFDKITYECNGLILEAPNWNPLTIPCPTAKTSVNNDIANKLITRGEYNIYKITDGTVIYLYNWKNKWYISTTRGIDMANIKIGTLTYIDLLNDALAKYNTNFDEFVEKLDSENSYSFVIRHAVIHPFTPDEDEGLIFVHTVTTKGGTIKFVRTHKLPFDIPCQVEVSKGVKLRELYSDVYTALDKWVATKKDPLFGYMLISNQPFKTGGDHSCILLVSSLMYQIRKFAYDGPFMKYGEDRTLAIATYGFLGPRRKIFLDLFPRYKQIFERLEIVQDELANGILKYLQNSNNDSDDSNCINHTELSNVTKNHTEYLAKIVQKKLKTTLQDRDSETVLVHVLGIINSTTHANIYMDLLK
jgi:hypothetical protein